MAAATTRVSLSPPPVSSISKPKLPCTSFNTSTTTHKLHLPYTSCLSSTKAVHSHHTCPVIPSKSHKLWRSKAASGEISPSESTALDTSQQIVSSSTSDDTVSTVISALLFVAFVALSILTIGVIYIAVTDFLQKREKEKFEKEEAAKKKKKGGKKVKVRARAGPRGFGQKIDEEEEDDG